MPRLLSIRLHVAHTLAHTLEPRTSTTSEELEKIKDSYCLPKKCLSGRQRHTNDRTNKILQCDLPTTSTVLARPLVLVFVPCICELPFTLYGHCSSRWRCRNSRKSNEQAAGNMPPSGTEWVRESGIRCPEGVKRGASPICSIYMFIKYLLIHTQKHTVRSMHRAEVGKQQPHTQ